MLVLGSVYSFSGVRRRKKIKQGLHMVDGGHLPSLDISRSIKSHILSF